MKYHPKDRFHSPEEVKEWAREVVKKDYQRCTELGMDINPFCTDGARNDWQRGFNNSGPGKFDHPDLLDYNFVYQRGRAMAELLESFDK
jgi:hypothetical protein